MAVDICDYLTLGDMTQGAVTLCSQYPSLGDLISKSILPNVLIIANIILFFLILFGGFTIITNAGSADKQKQGSQILTGSLIGFVLIFAAYWIMQIVNKMTGFDFLNPGI